MPPPETPDNAAPRTPPQRPDARQARGRVTHPRVAPDTRTIVVKRGRVGNSVEALVSDLRTVLQPNTATKLRESARSSGLRVLAGPLGVTHLLLLSRTGRRQPKSGAFPRPDDVQSGKYSLGNDVRSAQRRPVDYAAACAQLPLLC